MSIVGKTAATITAASMAYFAWSGVYNGVWLIGLLALIVLSVDVLTYDDAQEG